MNITMVHNPSHADLDAVRRGLMDFNRHHMDIRKMLPLAFFIEGENGEKLAGLTGSLSGHWLRIDLLWVSDALRGQGVGTRLIAAAEAEARSRECLYAQVDTASFQARPFYEKLGFSVGWTLDDYPQPGMQRFYLTKHL